MSDVFGQLYSQAYDVLYQDKDYEAECDLLTSIFERYGGNSVRRILDLGCGTGNHALPLAERGYTVMGVDRSREMLEIARTKVKAMSRELTFHEADIRYLDMGQNFDAVLMMFAVLGYQLDNGDVMAVLKGARRHLGPGGLLVLDAWYGPAVVAQRPGDRVKVIPTSDGKLLRAASGELDMRRHICAVRYHLWHLENSSLVAESREEHRVRFFFPLELELFLQASGFGLVHLGAFPDLNRKADESTWNVLAVATAV